MTNSLFDSAAQQLCAGLRTIFYLVPISETFNPEFVTATGPSVHHVPEFISNAIPIFIFMCWVEAGLMFARGRNVYKLGDTTTSLFLGTTMQLAGMISPMCVVSTLAYSYIWEHHALYRLQFDSLATWLGLFVTVDFGFYWYHRTAHEFHFLWSAHSVHHSGETFNLATALRQGALSHLTSWLFTLPLALFFHPAVYSAHVKLNTLYQFWIHTQAVGYLGPLEYVLNTASHHRMHHRPPGNCNYGGMLIIWDRMFGTYRGEDRQRDYYGLAKQYSTHDAVWAHAEHTRRVVEVAARSSSGGSSSSGSSSDGSSGKSSAPSSAASWLQLASRVLTQCVKRRVKQPLVFRPRALWRDSLRPEGGVPAWQLWKLPAEKKSHRLKMSDKAAASRSPMLSLYLLFHFMLVQSLFLSLLVAHDHLSHSQLLATVLFLASCISTHGRLLDSWAGAARSETRRLLACLAASVLALVRSHQPVTATATAAAAAAGAAMPASSPLLLSSTVLQQHLPFWLLQRLPAVLLESPPSRAVAAVAAAALSVQLGLWLAVCLCEAPAAAARRRKQQLQTQKQQQQQHGVPSRTIGL